jgi:hypothetical protein
MGYNISWVAVKGLPLDQAVSAMELQSTTAFAEFASEPFTGQALTDGWHLFVASSCDSYLISEKVLSSLTTNCRAIACSIEEHVMFSSAEYWQKGALDWKVEHSSDEGGRHLKLEGTLPQSFDTHVREANRLQAGDSEVDFFFEVPLLLAREVCGFKHDETYEGFDYESFLVYSRSKTSRKWWQVW